MRRRAIVLALSLLVSPVVAAPKPATYYPAEAFFNATYDLPERIGVQVQLIASGQQTLVPTELFQMKTFEAARAFQAANGLPATGVVDRTTLDRLESTTQPLFRRWDFRRIAHPTRGRPIWMPQGMGLQRQFDKTGVTFKEPGDRFQVSYKYYANLSPERAYAWLLNNMRERGTLVHYSVIKDGWLAISATTAAGFDEYLRYHQDGAGILGFTAVWNNERGIVFGERIANLMSASLSSVMLGRPFIEPPSSGVEPAPYVAAAAPYGQPWTQPNFVPAMPAPERPAVPYRPPEERYAAPPAPPPAQANRPAPQAARPAAPTFEPVAPGPRVLPPESVQGIARPPAKPTIPPPAAIVPDRNEKRVALIIGNSAYKFAPEIPNPSHDSEDTADILKKLGFEVVEGQNLDYHATREKIKEFSEIITNADLALFFYAGHGLQVSGRNYLVPIDAQLSSIGNLEIDAINLETVLRAMQTQPRTNIVILDACRDNPLARSLKRSIASARAIDVGQGLAPVDAQGGTLIAFATDPGNVALDGSGTRNSPFTGALLKHIATPNLEIETMFKRVRREVIEVTHGKQTPWNNTSLTQEIYLASTAR